jgi:uncharacterized protein (TIGR02246 family)
MMKRSPLLSAIFFAAGLIAAGLFPACQRRPGLDTSAHAPKAPASDSASARLAIDSGNTKLLDAAIAGNPDRLAACFTDDGSLVFPNGRAIKGPDSIRVIARRLFRHYKVAGGALKTTSVRVNGNEAYETGKWTFVARSPGRKATAESGAYESVWKRRGDGWKLFRALAVPRTTSRRSA